ncbi:MAG: FAD-dependent oxidoreductase [Leptolyngbyaceae cyanobacterium MAG.088]|nr:FAD-dependent oxidoreductase [Leptolyngbyaceae cyanobacterium MAG.088]
MVRVVVLGGGIAGMSAAHELVERGFQVEVYELKDIPGGKARSINVPDSAGPGKRPLPGEHGFRFFPSFYKHVTATMKQIPYTPPNGGEPRTVFDNLVPTTRLAMARYKDNQNLIVLPDRFPKSRKEFLEDLKLFFQGLLQDKQQMPPLDELEFFADRIFQLFTSCKERRFGEYEKISWWDYLDAENKSPAYQALLARGLTSSLVASRAELASTKTIGDIFLQLILGMMNPTTRSTDRILNGPTNDVWINPWLEHLRQKGVKYHLSHRLRCITTNKDKDGTIRVTGAVVTDMKTKTDKTITIGKDEYCIAAVPVEIMAGLISKEMAHGDPTLTNIRRLGTSTAWMNGIQFYLNKDVPVTHGHVLYVDAPWALTSISQVQFWKDFPVEEFGDGTVKGIISAIPSNWGYFINPNTDEVGAIKSALGLKVNKPAQICSAEEIKTEVWEQMKRSLREDGKELLEDIHLKNWFLDPDIIHNGAELAKDPDKLNEVLDNDLPDFFKYLFLWIHTQESSVSLEQIADHLKVDQSQARLAVNALIGKGFVGPIPIPKDEKKDEKTELFQLHPGQERLCYRSRIGDPNANTNGEPLLVNLVDTWSLRPYVHTQIPNFFLASDYVRTNTDLATMEGANEAARRAVNSIIDASGVKAPYCKIWDLHQPALFSIWRWSDYLRYRKGLPWNGKISPWYLWLLYPFILGLDFLEWLFPWLR